MDPERLGLLGGVAADRPILVALLIAFGVSALAVIGVTETPGTDPGPGDAARMLAWFLVLPAAPLALAALAPARGWFRAGYAALIGAALVALYLFAPDLFSQARLAGPGLLDAPLLSAAFVLMLIFLAAASFYGGYLKATFLGVAAAILAVAGGLGLMALKGVAGADLVSLAALGVAFGGLIAAGVVADHAALFARGAGRRASAGLAARKSSPLAVYLAAVALAAFACVRQEGGLIVADFTLVWVAGAVAVLAVASALFAVSGALSLSEISEHAAVEENERRALQRRVWRPLRRILPVRSAYAGVAIAFVAAVAMAFDIGRPPAAGEIVFLTVAAAAAGALFFSLRAGLFVLAALLAALTACDWISALIGADPLAGPYRGAALAMTAALFGQLALAWRDARSPHLNPGETMEAALSDGAGRYGLGLLAAAAAFYAAGLAGNDPQASDAAVRMLLMGIVGFAFAPPLMTALSGLTGRDPY